MHLTSPRQRDVEREGTARIATSAVSRVTFNLDTWDLVSGKEAVTKQRFRVWRLREAKLPLTEDRKQRA